MGIEEPQTHDTIIINDFKYENISVGVYWDDVGVPA
jgi:hypothetical protein